MRSYLIRRLLLIIPTLLLVTIVVFGTIRFIPGQVIDLMVSEMQMASGKGTELTIEVMKHELGLDLPIHTQYIRWIKDALRGDLGNSLWSDTPVMEEILDRLPVSFELGLLALVIALLIAIPIGTYSAIRQDTIGDYLGRTFAILCISVPSFWLATMVIVYPSIWWNWMPNPEYIPISKNLGGNLLQFVIPGAILGMVLSGTTMRMTRTMMLEVLRQDYIRTAWAKGLKERTIIFRHVLKNSLIPVITIIGLLLPVMISGSIVLEQIFGLPGIGWSMIDALNQRDYPIISGINLLLASFILLANILVDLTYAWLDPRVQYK